MRSVGPAKLPVTCARFAIHLGQRVLSESFDHGARTAAGWTGLEPFGEACEAQTASRLGSPTDPDASVRKRSGEGLRRLPASGSMTAKATIAAIAKTAATVIP
jgi:hypothetical protein